MRSPIRRGLARASLSPWVRTTLLCALLLLSLSHHHHAAAAPSSSPLTETELIAVDLGHENMKISGWRVQEEDIHTKPGGTGTVTTTTTSQSGSVVIVLNDQTNRKSPPCVAFRYFKDPTAAAAAAAGAGDEAHEGGQLYPPGYQLERTFAEQAEALAPRFPTQVVCSPAQILGYALVNDSTSESPYALTQDQLTASYSFYVQSLCQQQQHRQKENELVSAVSGRDAIGVFVPFFATSTTASASDGAFFTAEEMTAMLLGYARRMAEKADAVDNSLSEEEERQLTALLNSTGAGGTRLRGHAVPRYAALTVPVHATVAQRQALLDAAALAGLRVVRLVHSTTGAAVQLAHTKAEQVFVEAKPQYVMVYDMGSQQAEVAIYRFAPMPPTVAKRVKYEGSVELQALVGSRRLGGAAFDECIAAQWDEHFFGGAVLSAVGKATSEAERRTAAKLRGSLLRAAHKAKETLSVNQDAYVTFDGLHADPAHFTATAQQHVQQRTATVTADGLLSLRYPRTAFERACRPLFDAAVALRDEAIAATHGAVASVAALHRFEVIGGGTRVPLLLQRLSEGYRVDGSLVDRTLNGDEAAVLGTTLLAVSTAPRSLLLRATQSVPRYRVQEWLTNNVYVSVTPAANGGEGEGRVSLRLLFASHETVLPATRSIRVPLTVDAAVDTSAVPDSVTVAFYSGSEADGAYRRRTTLEGGGDDASAVVVVDIPTCASCYARAHTVTGIAEAEATLRAQLRRRHGGSAAVVSLERAEVVVEAVATVSGIPHCSVAYLRAAYRVTPAVNATMPAEEAAEGGEAVEETETETEGTDNDAPQQQQQDEPPVPSAASPTTADVVEVRLVALPLRASPAAVSATTKRRTNAVPSTLQSYNMDRAELLRSHQRVRRLLDIDDVRLHRSTLRNDIESVLLWVKEQREWDAAAEGEERVNIDRLDVGWRDTVVQVGEWLDDFGETADVAALQERLAAMRAIKQALRDQHGT